MKEKKKYVVIFGLVSIIGLSSFLVGSYYVLLWFFGVESFNLYYVVSAFILFLFCSFVYDRLMKKKGELIREVIEENRNS